MIFVPRATAAQQVIVRTPGGAYDDIRREIIYEPFEKATGVKVVPVARRRNGGETARHVPVGQC
jgi:putative spermidine/putrescine transport system substrate-binding protein